MARIDSNSIGPSNLASSTLHHATTLRQDGLVGDAAFALVQGLRHLPWERIKRLTLSLRGVERIDASGVVALVRLFSRLEQSGKRLRLCNVSGAVLAELNRLGLTEVVEVVEEAAPDGGLCVGVTEIEADLPPERLLMFPEEDDHPIAA